MNAELRELYQAVILDHNKSPRNYGGVSSCAQNAEGYNPLCGDRVKVGVSIHEHSIEEVRFEGSGCAISQASASTMTEAVKGKSLEDARELYDEFHSLLTEDCECGEHLDESLLAFSGVREFPIRVKCATLPWHTLLAALEDSPKEVKTE